MKINNIFIVFLTILISLKSTIVFAHPFVTSTITIVEPNSNEPPNVTYLEKNDKAPFAGTLLNASAAAKFLATQELQKEYCQIEIDKNVSIVHAKDQFAIDNLNANIQTVNEQIKLERSIHKEKMGILATELQKTNQISNRQSRLLPLYVISGGLAGILVTLAIVLTINQSR